MKHKELVVKLVLFTMGITLLPAQSEASKKPKLSAKSILLKVGQAKVLKVKNTRKKARWSIKSGKKYIKLKAKKRASVKIVGVKKGTAKVQCKIGKKKLDCKVKVQKTKKVVANSSTFASIPTATPLEMQIESNIVNTSVPTTTMQVTEEPIVTLKPTATPITTVTTKPTVAPEETPIDWDASEVVPLQTAGPVASYDRLMVETAVSTVYINPVPGGIIREDMRFFGSDIFREDIEQITISDVNEVPENVLGVIDVSEKQNGSVRAWYVDSDDNGKYEMTIAQDFGVIANENSAYLFAELGCDDEKGEEHQTLVGLEYLDTYYVTDMTEMFAEMSVPSNVLDLGKTFDVSNVVNAEQMFRGTGEWMNLQCFTTNKRTYQWLRENAENIWWCTEAVGAPKYDPANIEYIIYGKPEIKMTGDYLMVEPQVAVNDPSTKELYDGVPEYYFFGSDIPRSQIEQLQITTTTNVPEEAMGFIDISARRNKSIIAWYVDEDQDGNYEMTIGQEGGVVANPNSSYLFSWLGGPILGLENLNTENVWNMECMFGALLYAVELDLGDDFHTEKVTEMNGMFSGFGYGVEEAERFAIRLGKSFDIREEVEFGLGISQGFWRGNYFVYVSTEEIKQRIKEIEIPPAGSLFDYDWIIVEEEC